MNGHVIKNLKKPEREKYVIVVRVSPYICKTFHAESAAKIWDFPVMMRSKSSALIKLLEYYCAFGVIYRRREALHCLIILVHGAPTIVLSSKQNSKHTNGYLLVLTNFNKHSNRNIFVRDHKVWLQMKIFLFECLSSA